MRSKNNKGSVLILFFLYLMLSLVFLGGSLSLINRGSRWVQIQSELDRCTYSKAAKSSKIYNHLGKLNTILKYLLIAKKAGALTVFLPPMIGINAKIAIDRAVELTVTSQNFLIKTHDTLLYTTPIKCIDFKKKLKFTKINNSIKRKSDRLSPLVWINKELPEVEMSYNSRNYQARSKAQIKKPSKDRFLRSGQRHAFSF